MTKTSIIVLKTVEYSESSVIATVLSKEHGKIGLIAKGARKPRSKFSGKISPGKLLSVVYYYKTSRSVQTLSEASYDVRLDTLAVDIEKMSVSMSVMELVSQLVHEGEVSEAIYDFTKSFLIWLDEQSTVSRMILPYVQVRLAQLAGLGIQLDVESESATCYFVIDAGSLTDRREAGRSLRLKNGQKHFLLETLKTRKSTVLNHNLPEAELKELINYLDQYFHYHLEGYRRRKSDAVFDQILRGTYENT